MMIPFPSPSRCLAAATLLATLTIPSPVLAGDSATRSTARQLGYDGVRAYQAGDYETASERLERAYRVLKAPSLALWSARALAKTGKLVESSERYLEATRAEVSEGGKQDVQRKAQADARLEREELLPRIPSLVINIDNADPENITLKVGDVEVNSAMIGVARLTNPGHLIITAQRGDEMQTEEIELVEAQKATITLTFSELSKEEEPTEVATSSSPDRAASPRQWQRPLGWGSLAGGVVGAGLGVTFGLMASSEYNSLNCPNDRCSDPSEQDRVKTYNGYRTISTVGFITGGVLAAAGVSLLLTAPQPHTGDSVALYLSPSTAGIRGTF